MEYKQHLSAYINIFFPLFLENFDMKAYSILLWTCFVIPHLIIKLLGLITCISLYLFLILFYYLLKNS